jgi:hypothetical protein
MATKTQLQADKILLGYMQRTQGAVNRRAMITMLLPQLDITDRFSGFELSDKTELPELSLVVGGKYRQASDGVAQERLKRTPVYLIGFSEPPNREYDSVSVLVCGGPRYGDILEMTRSHNLGPIQNPPKRRRSGWWV